MNFFKRKSKLEKLRLEYEKKMEASFHLSKINRKASDQLIQEAENILEQMKKEDESKT